jgi:hypothetical protein
MKISQCSFSTLPMNLVDGEVDLGVSTLTLNEGKLFVM